MLGIGGSALSAGSATHFISIVTHNNAICLLGWTSERFDMTCHRLVTTTSRVRSPIPASSKSCASLSFAGARLTFQHAREQNSSPSCSLCDTRLAFSKHSSCLFYNEPAYATLCRCTTTLAECGPDSQPAYEEVSRTDPCTQYSGMQRIRRSGVRVDASRPRSHRLGHTLFNHLRLNCSVTMSASRFIAPRCPLEKVDRCSSRKFDPQSVLT